MGSSPCPWVSAAFSSPLARVGAEGTRCNRLTASLPRLHPGKQRALSEGLAGCFLVVSLSFRNAQPTLPCLLRALPAAPPATPGPPLCQEIKCSLKKKNNDSRKPSVFGFVFCFQPSTHSSLPWGGRREGQNGPVPVRKGPSGGGGLGALHCQQHGENATKCHHCPLQPQSQSPSPARSFTRAAETPRGCFPWVVWER